MSVYKRSNIVSFLKNSSKKSLCNKHLINFLSIIGNNNPNFLRGNTRGWLANPSKTTLKWNIFCSWRFFYFLIQFDFKMYTFQQSFNLTGWGVLNWVLSVDVGRGRIPGIDFFLFFCFSSGRNNCLLCQIEPFKISHFQNSKKSPLYIQSCKWVYVEMFHWMVKSQKMTFQLDVFQTHHVISKIRNFLFKEEVR